MKLESETISEQPAAAPRYFSGFPPVLDACCGSRMFWFDRKNPLAIFVDKRAETHVLCDGRKLEIAPDKVADFTALPFPDDTIYLVVFDPPHMNSLGGNSWLAKKYGRLIGDWRDELSEGFRECLRVLKPNGTLVFKWNTTDIPADEVLALAPIRPLFGHTTGRQSKTIWAAFLKPDH
jgi:SAM-dependent methyltransferase